MPHLVLPVNYSMKSLSATLLNKDDDYRILGNHHGDANEKLTSQKISAIFLSTLPLYKLVQYVQSGRTILERNW